MRFTRASLSAFSAAPMVDKSKGWLSAFSASSHVKTFGRLLFTLPSALLRLRALDSGLSRGVPTPKAPAPNPVWVLSSVRAVAAGEVTALPVAEDEADADADAEPDAEALDAECEVGDAEPELEELPDSEPESEPPIVTLTVVLVIGE